MEEIPLLRSGDRLPGLTSSIQIARVRLRLMSRPGNPPLGYHFIIVNDGRKILLVVNGSAVRGVAHRVDDDDDD